MTTGNPLADLVAGLVEDLIAEGIHLLDPETRKRTVREAVARESAKWAALDPGLESARLDALAARYRIKAPE